MATTKKTTTKPQKTVTKKEVVESNILTETQPRSSMKPYLLVLLGFLLVVAYYGKHLLVAGLVNNRPIFRMQVIKELEKQGGQQALDSIVTQELIKQEAAKKGMTVTDEDLNNKMNDLDTQFKAQGQSLDKVLEQQGLNRDLIKDQLRVQIMLEKLLGDKIKVTEEEVDAAVEEQKEIFAQETDKEKVRTTVRETLKSQKAFNRGANTFAGPKEDRKNSTVCNLLNKLVFTSLYKA
ncbi:MAG: Foldase protein PrsA [Microgenomates bacterium OLB23]|nr:MAG: Foldase protein PrsA [Microgenomates bacterium OLB23]